MGRGVSLRRDRRDILDVCEVVVDVERGGKWKNCGDAVGREVMYPALVADIDGTRPGIAGKDSRVVSEVEHRRDCRLQLHGSAHQ